MWKDLAVSEMAKIRNEVEDVTRRAQAEFHQHGAVLQAADVGYQQTRGRQDAMEGMLTELRKAVEMVANPVAELRSAVEMITNKMSKMQDLEKDLERTKRIVEALRARPTGSSEDPAQAPQGVSSDGGTGMQGGSLARGEQPQASGPNVDGGTHYRTQMDYSKMFDHRMAVNYLFDGKIKAEEWVKTRNFFLGRCRPTEWMLEWAEKRNAEIRPEDLVRAANEKGETEDVQRISQEIWSCLNGCLSGEGQVTFGLVPNFNGWRWTRPVSQ